MKFLIVSLFMIILFPVVSFSENYLPIGVYLSTTGPVAAWGKLEWQGIKVANELKPYTDGKRIKLILEDVGSKPEGAAMSVERLIAAGVKFVIGPVSTTNALAAIPILDKAGVVDMIPTANGMGLVKDKRFVSRVCLTNDVQSKIMAHYILSNKKYKSGIVVEDITQDYSVDLAHRFIRNFIENGGEIIKVYKIGFTQNDFSALAANIKNIKPQFVYISAYYNTIALFLRELRALNCNVKVFAGSAASSYALIKIAGKSAQGLEFTDDFDPLLPQNKIAQSFIKLFKEKYNRLPDSPEALAADAYLLLVKAINTVGNNPMEVAKYIRNTTFHGVSGKIIIKNGVLNRTVVIREVNEGSFRPIDVFKP